MFTHRVLPLPSPLTTVTTPPDAQADRQDNLSQNSSILAHNSNMTSIAYRGPTDIINTRRASLRSSSPRRNRLPNSPHQESVDSHHTNSALIVGPSQSLQRKRSPSQDSIEEIQRSEYNLPSVSRSSNLARTSESASQVCLCQPDPKVPRPRNAFILYRQHHQTGVVAQHPGLANPEISKIIGELWRRSSPEIKNHWKLLAEEEKLRHQRQYPDYRYQPRRHGRNSVTNAALLNNSDPPRCLKCGGRSMATSGMGTPGLFTPATPTTAYGAMAPPYTPFTSSGANRPLRIVGSLTTSQTGNVQNRHMMPNGGSNLGQYSWRGETRGEEMDGPMSPGNKRRRVDNGPSTPVRAQAGQLTPFPFSQRRESLPRPDFMPKSNFPLAAPPKSNHHSSSSHDSSLTLPPLKTGAASDAFSQAKSVEAMIMSILPINKIKILAKITPRLASPGPASPPHATRGVIIAVDGADHEAVNMVVAHLEDIFSKDETHKLRIWDSPTIEADASLADYLGVITRWHAISTELIEYITTVPSPTSPPPVSPKTQAPILPLEDHDNPLEPEKASPASTAADAPPSSTAAGAPLLPIAIVPRYQLTLTDLAASTIPIADAYAPVDHWQWMATLWRGIVGPDITIVVRPASNQYDGSSANGNSSPREETRNGGGVEVRLQDARTITLLCPNVGKVPESALRRMGFELGEYVRYLKTGERWT